jgi:hypothetical protein
MYTNTPTTEVKNITKEILDNRNHTSEQKNESITLLKVIFVRYTLITTSMNKKKV